MKYAVIAAGDGSRLVQEGIEVPKPLVSVNGEQLIDRLIRIFVAHDAEEIVVICKDSMPAVYGYLQMLANTGWNGTPIPLRVLTAHTPSSMHSLYAMRGWLSDSAFCLTTVDTVFGEAAFAGYIATLQLAVSNGVDALMGVTRYVDDEKPLYVETDEQLAIRGFHDANPGGCQFVSAGIYGLQPCALDTLCRCIERGEYRMRNFQRALIADGLAVRAYDMGQVLDIDHAADIAKAELFLDRGLQQSVQTQ